MICQLLAVAALPPGMETSIPIEQKSG